MTIIFIRQITILVIDSIGLWLHLLMIFISNFKSDMQILFFSSYLFNLSIWFILGSLICSKSIIDSWCHYFISFSWILSTFVSVPSNTKKYILKSTLSISHRMADFDCMIYMIWSDSFMIIIDLEIMNFDDYWS